MQKISKFLNSLFSKDKKKDYTVLLNEKFMKYSDSKFYLYFRNNKI